MTEPEARDLTENQVDGKESAKRKTSAFRRPEYSQPKHTVLSSPFARVLMLAVAGPLKPVWYKAPSAAQLYTFRNIVALIEDGREMKISLCQLTNLIQKLVPSVTTVEIRQILKRLDMGKQNELDIGEFIFLLANSPFQQPKLKEPKYKKGFFTTRHRVLYSGLAYYCLVQTEDDVNRFYTSKSQPHPEVLRYHTAAARNQGLNEYEMDKKQEEARNIAKTFKKKAQKYTAYTNPVPFVPGAATKKPYLNYIQRRKALPKSGHPKQKKRSTPRMVKSVQMAKEGDEPIPCEDEEDYLSHLFITGQLPRPHMRIPAENLKNMRKVVTEDEKAYLKLLKEEAMKLYYERMKFAIVGSSKKILKTQLQKGFRDDAGKLQFFSILRTLMPLSTKEHFVLQPWISGGVQNPKSDKASFTKRSR